MLTITEFGYVFLTAQLCGDCRHRVDQGERAFLVAQLEGVRR